MNVYIGAAGGMSDHYLVEAKVKMKGFRKREREEVIDKRVLRAWEGRSERKYCYTDSE